MEAKYRKVTVSKKGIVKGEEWHPGPGKPYKVVVDGKTSTLSGKGFWCLFEGDEDLMKVDTCWQYADKKTVHALCMEAGYPDMALSGDWSGLRDSEPEQIKAMAAIAQKWWDKKMKGQPWRWQLPEAQKKAA